MPAPDAALPPGPRSSGPIALAAFWTRTAGSLLRARHRYGTRFTVRLPFQPPMVILSDPEEIRELFAAAPDAIHPGEGARVLEPMLGRHSVILLDEEPHLEQRRLLLPAFQGDRMAALTGLMDEIIAAEVAGWPTGEPVSLHPALQRMTLEIILRAVFGLTGGRRQDALREALAEVLRFGENPLSVMPPQTQARLARLPAARRFRAALARADAEIFALIAERRAAARAGDGDGDGDGDGTAAGDVLAMLLGARHPPNGPADGPGSPMSDAEIRDELMTALVAGHETTASQLAWGLALLARAPEVQARLRAELADGGGQRYLTATIQEILRLRPVLPNAEPRLTKRPVRIGGFEYPAGVALIASAWLVHHDPAIYPEPARFRPERFLERPPGTYTWLPFGGGRRRCLGVNFALLEMGLALRAIVARFELEPAGRGFERIVRRSITFRPARGGHVILRPRTGTPQEWISSPRSVASTASSSATAA